ncbi:unnamed protein product [Closterium sp. NIES-54]
MVTTTSPGGQRVSICTCTRTGRYLATFTRQVAPPCSCRLLSHQTLFWHHRLGHPSLPRLRGMHSRLLLSGLPRSLPPLPPLPAPPCLPCIEGRQRAAPHSSFPKTTTPLQTLHMDVEVPDVLILWIRAVHLQLRERFREDLPVLRLHSNRGGEFSSDLLQDFCRGEGILQSFMLPASPQQNGVAERRIGLVMELNLWPRVSLSETSPTLRWTGKVGDASMFRVDPLPGTVPIKVAVDLGAARGVASGGAASWGAEPATAERGGAESEGAESKGAKPGGAERGGTKLEGAEPGGAESEGAESGGAEPRGTASARGPAAASLRLCPRREPFSPQ